MINLPITAITDITANMTDVISDLMPIVLFLGGIIVAVYVVSGIINNKVDKE